MTESVLLSIIIFVLILSFLVLIHELGHFIAARLAKIKVEEFGLGYPPLAKKLFSWKGTVFTLNWVPFGGFIKMEGEEGQPSSQVEKTKKDAQNRPFYEASAPWRLIVILAGASVNFVFGVIAFAIVYSFLGIPTPLNQPRIGMVLPDSPAATAGVPEQVNVIAIRQGEETVPISTTQEAIDAIKNYSGETIILVTTGPCQEETCQESAQEFEVYVRTQEELEAAGQNGAVGIAFQPEYTKFYPWYEMPFRGMWFGLQQAIGLSLLILNALGTMVGQLFSRGQVPTDIMGPVGIVDSAARTNILLQGPLAILQFAGLISINLAIMNVLPIPALDGGRALFIILEKIFGREKVSKVEGVAHYGGFIFLMALILLVTGRDIWRIVVGA